MRHLCDACIICDKAMEEYASLFRNILNIKELEGYAFFSYDIQHSSYNSVSKML